MYFLHPCTAPPHLQLYAELLHAVTVGGKSLKDVTAEMARRQRIDLSQLTEPKFDDIRVVHR
jgi:hypothetical protein